MGVIKLKQSLEEVLNNIWAGKTFCCAGRLYIIITIEFNTVYFKQTSFGDGYLSMFANAMKFFLDYVKSGHYIWES